MFWAGATLQRTQSNVESHQKVSIKLIWIAKKSCERLRKRSIVNYQTNHIMRKLFQNVFSYKTIDVVDANNGQKQEATYFMLLGLTFNITYK